LESTDEEEALLEEFRLSIAFRRWKSRLFNLAMWIGKRSSTVPAYFAKSAATSPRRLSPTLLSGGDAFVHPEQGKYHEYRKRRHQQRHINERHIFNDSHK
jgi:hypothetical protein